MNVKPFTLVLILFLTGCAAKTRDDPGAFVSIAKGEINPTEIPLFVDCLMDGFSPIFQTRQQRRVDGFRVETYIQNGRKLDVSVDVFDNGKINMYRAKNTIWIEREKAAFANCFEQFNGIEESY